MQQPIILNKGITKTVINNNGNKDENEIKWDAKYDGKKADINLDFSKNCKKNKMHIELSNMDLSRVLGVRPIPIPLEQRLKNDFLDSDSDIDSDSDSDSDSDFEEAKIVPFKSNTSSSQLEEDLAKLLHIKTLTPSPSYKPNPYLFRVNIPRTKMALNNVVEHRQPKDSLIIMRNNMQKQKSKSDSELLKISEMLFDPAFDLSAPPIQLREPTHITIPSGLPSELPSALSTLTPDSLILPSSFRVNTLTAKRGKNGKKTKAKKLKIKRKNAYKTPAPKTLRVHLTSNKSSRKSKSNSNSKSKSNSVTNLAKKLGFYN